MFQNVKGKVLFDLLYLKGHQYYIFYIDIATILNTVRAAIQHYDKFN